MRVGQKFIRRSSLPDDKPIDFSLQETQTNNQGAYFGCTYPNTELSVFVFPPSGTPPHERVCDAYYAWHCPEALDETHTCSTTKTLIWSYYEYCLLIVRTSGRQTDWHLDRWCSMCVGVWKCAQRVFVNYWAICVLSVICRCPWLDPGLQLSRIIFCDLHSLNRACLRDYQGIRRRSASHRLCFTALRQLHMHLWYHLHSCVLIGYRDIVAHHLSKWQFKICIQQLSCCFPIVPDHLFGCVYGIWVCKAATFLAPLFTMRQSRNLQSKQE